MYTKQGQTSGKIRKNSPDNFGLEQSSMLLLAHTSWQCWLRARVRSTACHEVLEMLWNDVQRSFSPKLQVSSPSEIFTLGEWKVDALRVFTLDIWGLAETAKGKWKAGVKSRIVQLLQDSLPISESVSGRCAEDCRSSRAVVATYSSSLKSSSSESSESLHLRTIETIEQLGVAETSWLLTCIQTTSDVAWESVTFLRAELIFER